MTMHAKDDKERSEHDVTSQSLPPRSRMHRRKIQKKKKQSLSFPLIRLLLVLFLALIVAAVTSPYWLP
ncbi:hypothetical protein [Halalkalibacter krulwichiae]|uniref:Uncharacterized protein n=1 Tax=Halalkalibacter krulwichiae TaxID=199441 RepID=A0A1X9M9X7_9BACI|nr:hypothetical protein [Halalkalibacter krulwichiae]ARK30269.1 hypothetical protein BkAM31D_10770 [Halalkalibacter krulwichiae]